MRVRPNLSLNLALVEQQRHEAAEKRAEELKRRTTHLEQLNIEWKHHYSFEQVPSPGSSVMAPSSMTMGGGTTSLCPSEAELMLPRVTFADRDVLLRSYSSMDTDTRRGSVLSLESRHSSELPESLSLDNSSTSTRRSLSSQNSSSLRSNTSFPSLSSMAPQLPQRAQSVGAQTRRHSLSYSPHSVPSNSSSIMIPITPYLMLSCAAGAVDVSQLRHYQIRHVINVAAEVPLFCSAVMPEGTCLHSTADQSPSVITLNRGVLVSSPLATCLHLPWTHASDDIQQDFEVAFRVIETARCTATRAMVHCSYGVCRSAALVMAYLMWRKQWRLDQAYEMVQQQAPHVAPNMRFIFQLHEHERNVSNQRVSSQSTPVMFSMSPVSPVSDEAPRSAPLLV